MKNIFVVGLDPLNHHWLKRLPGAQAYRFHQLLSFDQLQRGPDVPIEQLIQAGEQQLANFDGPIDAIVSYWDFPGTLLVPILAQRVGCSSPPLEAMLKCEHKYWSRHEQSQVTDACPAFAAVDPYDDRALEKLDLAFPFWIKPVKAFLAQCSYRIDSAEDFYRALPVIREKLPRMGEPFSHVLRMVDLPPEVAHVDGLHCIAEAAIGGAQCTLEGYLRNGRIHAYGVVDSHCYPGTTVFSRLEYPSRLPENVQQRMASISEAVMRRIGLENLPFNIEFFWDEKHDKVWLLEINPRISQSHAFVFEQVSGVSNLHALIELALGNQPRMQRGGGRYGCAAKFMLRTFRDGIVRRVPSEDERQRVEQRFADTVVDVTVSEGDRLSALLSQDSYSYLLAEIFLAAENQAALLERYEQCLAMLPFEIDESVAEEQRYEGGRASAA